MRDLVSDLRFPRVDTLGHILQEYLTTSQMRIVRHVYEILIRALTARNWRTWVELTIRTTADIRRPYIVAAKGNRAFIVDTSISADANATSEDDV